MSNRRLAAIAAALAALTVPAGASADVKLKSPDLAAYPQVSVTAVTSRVSASPPRLREGGRPVAGFEAQNLGRSKSVVLAVDRSQSMAGQALKDATSGARAFIAAKPPSDRIAVVSVGRRALQLTRFSSATIDADIALRSFSVDNRYGTALYDAVALSARALRAEPLAGRVLILLTDGQEVSSKSTLPEAIEAARASGVAVYPIAIESSKFSPAPLRELAQATGGSYYGAASSAALAGVYRAIAAELKRTWRLRYVTAGRPGERLQLEARAPGSGVAKLTVVLPGQAATDPGEASGLLPQSAYSSAWSPLALGLAVGFMLLLAWGLVVRARRGSWVRNRLAPHVEQHVRQPKRQAARERFATGATVLRMTERAFGHLRFWRSIHAQLERADVPLRTVEFLYISIGAGFFTGMIAAFAGRSTLVILAALVGGGLIPYGFLWFKARRRLNAFENQLPDLLLTMAASLKAGHSFKSSLQTIVDEGAEPASKEFNRVLTETRLGRPMEDALTEMSARVGSKNLEFVITAVTIQGQVGGSLAGLFDMVAEAVRQRQQFARKIKGLTAMGRASAYVLVGLPFLLAGLLTLMNGQYMEPLWHTSSGHMLLVGMAVAIGLGSLMLKKIVSFKG
ncbi:MAG: type II secretion system F family protein [Gaiellaceae bacterium]